MSQNGENSPQWYAIRVTYSRELLVKEHLDSHDIGNYLPMHCVERTRAGKKYKIQEPLIRNLIFIHATAECMKSLKTHTTLPICYIMDRAAHIPLVVPDQQMANFIRVATAQQGPIEVIDTQGADFTCGDLVRVTEGIFAGVEGRYIRHKGHYKVAVEIHGIATALTAYIPSRSVTKINPPKPKGQDPAELPTALNL